MKNVEYLFGDSQVPYKPDAVIVLENGELAKAVGEYVEKNYGVFALMVQFDMKRKRFGSSVADVAASVCIRKERP